MGEAVVCIRLVDFNIPRATFALLRNFGRAPLHFQDSHFGLVKHLKGYPDLISHRSESDRCDFQVWISISAFHLQDPALKLYLRRWSKWWSAFVLSTSRSQELPLHYFKMLVAPPLPFQDSQFGIAEPLKGQSILDIAPVWIRQVRFPSLDSYFSFSHARSNFEVVA